MALHIGPYGDILRTYVGDIHGMLVEDIAWRYIQDHPGTSPVCYIFMSLANQQGMAAEEILRTLAQDVPYHYIEGHLGMSTGCLSGTSLGLNFAKRVFFKLFVILMMIRECSFMTSHFNYFIRFLICQKQNILS